MQLTYILQNTNNMLLEIKTFSCHRKYPTVNFNCYHYFLITTCMLIIKQNVMSQLSIKIIDHKIMLNFKNSKADDVLRRYDDKETKTKQCNRDNMLGNIITCSNN